MKQRRRKEDKEPPKNPEPTKGQKTKAFVALLLSAGSTVGGIYAAGLFVYTVWSTTYPTIDPAANTTQAFSVPFMIKNTSWLFTMDEVSWYCRIIKSEGSDIHFDNVKIFSDKKVNIGRSEQSLGGCYLAKDNTYNATIIVGVNYKILSFSRNYEVPFTWISDATPPQWIRGAIQ